MPRPLKYIVKLEPVNKRFQQIFNEWKKDDYHRTYELFAEELKLSTPSVFRMVNGKLQVTQKAVKAVSSRLGYSTEWLLHGTGPKKTELKDKSTLTEVSALRTDIQFLMKEIEMMKARMKSYENKG